MTKTDFIKVFASDNNMTQSEAVTMVSRVCSQIERALKEDGELSFPGWGKLEVKHIEPRQVRNPQTGEMMLTKAKNTVKFKAGSKLNAIFNQA